MLAALSLATFALPALAAVKQLPPIPTDLSTPVQQRLAFQGPTAMAVGWNTYKQLSAPTVHYGTSPTSLNSTASSASSVTYKTSRTWANSVLISGLQPATTYYYKIDSTNSSIDSFVTARKAGDTSPFTVAAVIDMGVFGADGVTVKKRDAIPAIDPALNHTTIGRLFDTAADYDFVIHPGDLAYADDWIVSDPLGVLSESDIYEGLVEQFFNELASVSRMKPYMVSPGNHEADCVEVPLFPCVTGQTNFTGYVNRFGNILPAASSSPSTSSVVAARRKRAAAASLAQPPFWYSFDYGMAHFVMIDTETDLGKGLVGPEEKGGSQNLVNGPFGAQNQQIQFLQADLASVDRTITPWIIVAGHRPWYTDGTACTVCQTAFEPIFNQYGVDLAVFGHVHNMQLIAPITNGTVDPAGLNNPTSPWYIVNGAAGNVEGFSSLSSSPPSYVTWANDNLYGFSKLLFHNRTNLEVQFISSTDGALLKSATLYKSHTTAFVGS
ncbi:Metallo-dependent phosphatase [Clavulina sp. PMI_390]|nr:Metallo-dependent phosphatase [Clavulina sp. PMI_390]